MFHPKFILPALGFIFAFDCQSLSAATSPVADQIAQHLYSGELSQAAKVAQTRLRDAPGDDPTRFALGTVQFFQAVEHLSQQFYRYGLANEFQDRSGLAGLPILRLPVPANSDPDTLTYETFQGILASFDADLDRAENTLGAVASEDIDLQLNLGLVKLDLDGNGQASENEYIWMQFQRVANLRGLNSQSADQLMVDLDASDVPWLQAYCHLLMAITEFPLAYDWHEAFDQSFFNLFRGIDTPLSRGMAAEKAAMRAELDELQAEFDAFVAEGAAKGLREERLRKLNTETWPEYRKRLDAYYQTPQGKFNTQLSEMRWAISQARSNDFYEQIADLVAFVHLNHWPLTDKDRLQSVLSHLESVVSLSRENWRRILAETDNRKEWIPNPGQTGVIPGVRVQPQQAEGWQLFLDEFEAVLKGDKLIPHWRFVKGFNLRRFFTEPTDFDIVLLVQGSAALPYLEEGDEVDEQTWRRISNLLGGDILRYFIWFN